MKAALNILFFVLFLTALFLVLPAVLPDFVNFTF